MTFEPIAKKRIYHEIIRQIKLSIVNGQINPGEQLPSERYLADALSVSRTSVREAISVLDASGVVTIRPGVGVFLKDDPNVDILLTINSILKESFNLVEILEFRKAVEGDAAYYAAQRSTPQELGAIQIAFVALESAVMQREIAANEDYAFHMAICKAAKNLILQKVIFFISDALLDGLNESRSKTLQTPGKSEVVLEEHRRIYEAIRNKNAALARKEMWEHLEQVKVRFTPLLRESRLPFQNFEVKQKR
ncbi:FadR/GntR family transcriptional regulator [Lentibacillus sp. N15]|uniref:FadR/GntR family transcriptional regulator n=1 Tax=Lentibacillus songyuanensis TaxID=3136161 RepID=UPI0031BAB2A3